MSLPINAQDNDFSALTKESIAYFKCAITAQNFQYFGLSSEDALDKVSIGEAIKHHAVGLRELQKYDTLTDPNSLIMKMNYVTVPLLQKDKNTVETFLMLSSKDGKYQSTGIGNAPYAAAYMKYLMNNESVKGAKLIRVPALNVAYAGIEVKGDLFLVPLLNTDQKDNVPRPAKLVFAELAKQIGDYDEDVPH